MGKNTSIVLGEAHETFIREQIARGRYASVSEAVRDAVAVLIQREEAVERWLNAEVGPVYDAMRSDPERGVPLETAFRALRRKTADAA